MAREPYPDEIVDPAYRAMLTGVARAIDEMLNGKNHENPKQHGFIIAMFALGDTSRFNYMSNCNREDIVTLLKEMTARFEGMPEVPTTRA
jgi:hypothetical protein